MTATDYAPQGFHTVSPYLVVDDPAAAIDLYTRAFGAREILRHTDDKGRITHAEIMVGDSPIMLSGGFEVGQIVAEHTFDRVYRGIEVGRHRGVDHEHGLAPPAAVRGAGQIGGDDEAPRAAGRDDDIGASERFLEPVEILDMAIERPGELLGACGQRRRHGDALQAGADELADQ